MLCIYILCQSWQDTSSVRRGSQKGRYWYVGARVDKTKRSSLPDTGFLLMSSVRCDWSSSIPVQRGSRAFSNSGASRGPASQAPARTRTGVAALTIRIVRPPAASHFGALFDLLTEGGTQAGRRVPNASRSLPEASAPCSAGFRFPCPGALPHPREQHLGGSSGLQAWQWARASAASRALTPTSTHAIARAYSRSASRRGSPNVNRRSWRRPAQGPPQCASS